MKGCGHLSHLSALQPLQHSFALHYVYDADASSILFGRSILVIWNACYNTGNKSMRGPFDPPMQVTNNNTAVLNAMAVSHSRTIAI